MLNYSTFAYQEVKGVKEVKELRRMSCCLKKYAKKTVVLTPLTPLTSELVKLESFRNES